MSQVTYRGAKYDTEERKARPVKQVQVHEQYRGVKFDKLTEVAK